MAFPSVNQINYGAQNPNGVYVQNQMTPAQPTGITTGNVQVDVPKVGGGVDNPALSAAQTPIGMNLGTGQLALGAIGTIGNLWAAWKAQKLAQEQFDYQKGITDTNLANQIQTYNTSLAGRAELRGQAVHADPSTTEAWIEENKLRDRR